MCLTSHPGRYDAESQTLVTGTLCNNGKAAGSATQQDAENGFLVTHALRGEGHDASEDGTGRGVPLLPMTFPWQLGGTMQMPHDVDLVGTLVKNQTQAVAFDLAHITSATNRTRAEAGAKQSRMHVATSAVRRLTPRECERLQGFPDHWTAITHRGKPAADGPRYKALGNSMAVPVLTWIGKRIAMQEALQNPFAFP
jgi:DNA (cytosine-5)-methyltransferase 1